MWEKERPTLHPLPPQPFEACRLRAVTVSKMSTVVFETNQYSVPCAYVGHKVWVKVFVDKVSIVAQNEVIATHLRCDERDQMILELDHYLDILLRKPRAIRDARAMNSPNVPEVVRSYHREMRRRHGADGDRAFVRFLLLHREVGMEAIASVLNTASSVAIYHLEGLHELLLRETGQAPAMATLPPSQIPVDLSQYRVQKADATRYNALTSGGVQ